MTTLNAANDCELLEETHSFLNKMIKTPDITVIKQKFDRCRATRGTKCVQGMALIGPAGTGKTRLIDKYVEENPRYTDGLQQIVPVLKVSLPEKATSKVMLSRLLRELTGLKNISGTEENIQGRLSSRLNAARTELIIVDETQHLTRESSSTTVQHAADAIKALMTDTKIPVICVGMESSKTLLTGKTKFKHEKQLYRRNRKLHFLAPYECGSGNWKSLIKQYQSLLQCNVDLTTNEVLTRLYVATGGLFGFITPLFMEAIEIAGSTKEISIKTLAAAYEGFQPENKLAIENPFKGTLAQVEVELTRLLEERKAEAIRQAKKES